jgi:hypothetical protein
LRVRQPRQTEIANLEVAVLVDKNVGRLEVTVNDSGRVDVLETTEDLVQEVLDELLLERPGGEETVEVGTEELGDKVDVLERRDEDVGKADDVLVSDMLQELQLTIGALGEDGGTCRKEQSQYRRGEEKREGGRKRTERLHADSRQKRSERRPSELVSNRSFFSPNSHDRTAN